MFVLRKKGVVFYIFLWVLLICLPFLFAQPETSLNYDPEILSEFNNREFVSVLVRLKSAENFDISKQIPLEQRAINYERKKEHFKRMGELIISKTPNSRFESVIWLSDGFIANVDKKTFDSLIRNHNIRMIYGGRMGSDINNKII